MTNNKQSSVEWYSVKRDVLEIEVRLGKISSNEYAEELAKGEKQAKAMHKEEHKDSYHAKLNDWWVDFEQYYNETFGGNND